VTATDLTVLTYNTGLGLVSAERLAETLLAADADIVGLQELDPSLAGIGAALRDVYPYQALHPLGIPGKGILSRYPLREARLLPFIPGRPDLRATVETGAGPVDLFVAHPPPLRITRREWHENASAARQIRALAAAATAGEPAILLGDFNRLRSQQAYRLLRAAGLIDAFGAAGQGWGGTLPTRLFGWAQRGHVVGAIPLPPVLRVDYVWHTRHFTTLASWTGPHAGSDHLPVIARLRLDEGVGGRR
jgi:vancomycin resistance protein VanJ